MVVGGVKKAKVVRKFGVLMRRGIDSWNFDGPKKRRRRWGEKNSKEGIGTHGKPSHSGGVTTKKGSERTTQAK